MNACGESYRLPPEKENTSSNSCLFAENMLTVFVCSLDSCFLLT